MEKGSGKGTDRPLTSTTSSKAVLAFSNRVGNMTRSSQGYERTSKLLYKDKQSGSYQHISGKEKLSTGEHHVEKGLGRVGVRDELTRTWTYKVADRDGYTEYRVEEKVRDVRFGGDKSVDYDSYDRHDYSDGSHGYDSDDNSYTDHGIDCDGNSSDHGYWDDSYAYDSDHSYSAGSYGYDSDDNSYLDHGSYDYEYDSDYE
ncbi:hypothetical protein NMG60_11005747 [Bertholletia excelsa]